MELESKMLEVMNSTDSLFEAVILAMGCAAIGLILLPVMSEY